MHNRLLAVLFVSLSMTISVKSQDPLRFQEEIDKLASIEYPDLNNDSLLLFTGSSSIKMWKTLQDYFENYYTINNGFGGSQMSDLLHFSDVLIDPFDPKFIFIYEGDNDIALGKTKKEIVKNTKKLLRKIKKKHPDTFIVLLAAKPSPLRWGFKTEYETLNRYFEKTAIRKKNIFYADVWTPMLDNKGEVMKELFIKDDLHMNEKGYIIWGKVLNDLINSIHE